MFSLETLLASKYPQSDSSFLFAVIYEGSCNTTGRWSTALHLIVNILRTCVLAASNYCMQSLVAPSRDGLDIAHAKHQWLRIGSSSVKNLLMMPFGRLGLWFILLITTTPFHLLYNSVVFESLSSSDYWKIVAPYDIDSHNPRFAAEVAEGNYERLSAQQCNEYDYTSYPFGYKGLLFLADNLTVSNGGNASILGTLSALEYGLLRIYSFAKRDSSGQRVCQ
ncbi:hypothetical protein N7449_005988 [Penicillium cf. viridicatum]|uniref:DUF6536 domain-containing protein n=1 Tax=Penicillium cf. viridicatum TaxID=2972119 RepID=A0A9W9SWU0_9EURO|nr:hypothetical protein N7449_005988 [Penicillium cf. viridicatum]